MKQAYIRKLPRPLIALLFLATFTHQVHAAPPLKERLVLMPLRLAEEDNSRRAAMETALVQGLQQKYEVFSGEQVTQKAREIFLKESRNTAKKECDETRCMQGIAEAFQAELIATANVSKQVDGYFLALSIQNIFDNKVVYSNSVPCKNCDAYQVVDKLKELSGSSVQVASTQTDSNPTPARSIALPAVPVAPRVTGNSNDAETQVWAEVVAGNKIDDYKLYLDSYPQGKYAKQATDQKQKIEAYAKAKDDAAVAKENELAWNDAQQGNSVASYTQYLKQYPNGTYAVLAKIKKNKAVIAAETAVIPAIQANMIAVPGKNYEIGKYEVTQAEWETIMGNNPSLFKACGVTCPVENISWNDIYTFIQLLNSKSGKQYRLPSETEWEYACYAGNKTQFCGGNDFDAVAWYKENCNLSTHPVGQKQANSFGLYDMSGNVSEWLANQLDTRHAMRGDSWMDITKGTRMDESYYGEPTSIYTTIGFRLARTLP